jgi:hypothetical protein
MVEIDGGKPQAGLILWRITLWQEIPRLAVILMELCWMVPWFQLITLAAADTNPARIALVFGLVIFMAYALARSILLLSIKAEIQRVVFLGFILIASIFSLRLILYSQNQATDLSLIYNQPLDSLNDFRELIPPEILVVFAVLYSTRRGFRLARDWDGANSVINSIQTSVILFTAFGFIGKKSTGEVITVNLFVFLIAAVFGMVTARIGSIRGRRGGRGAHFDMQWLGSILATTLMITGIAAAVAVISADQLVSINQSLRLVFYTVFLFIATPFFALISRVFPALDTLQQALQIKEPVQNIPEWELENTKPPAGEFYEEIASSGVEVFLQLRFVILVVMVLVATFLIIRMVHRLRGREIPGEYDERQSLLAGTSLLRFILEALRGKVKQTADDLVNAARLNRRQQFRAAARIRRIYAELMQLCVDLGSARPTSQTPQEFLPAVVLLFPQEQSELVLITESYQRVRYGELPETHHEIQAVELAWERVAKVGKTLKSN